MATQKAFQEELNPYEIAKQQFNRAADYLDLDASLPVSLREHPREDHRGERHQTTAALTERTGGR